MMIYCRNLEYDHRDKEYNGEKKVNGHAYALSLFLIQVNSSLDS